MASVVVGLPAGMTLGGYEWRFKGMVIFFILLPILVPPLASTMGVHVTFIRLGLADTVLGVFLVHLVPTVPYTAIIMTSIFAERSGELEEAARTLGASPWQAFLRVTLPEVAPGVAVAGLFAFLISWGQYVLTLLIGGGNVVTLPMLLFSSASGNDPVITSALALVFALPAVLALVIALRFLKPGPPTAAAASWVWGRSLEEVRTVTARLELENVAHRYSGAPEPALSGLTLAVEPGELVALLGPSGCGKTTTLKVVAGLLRPTSGDVRVEGRSVVGPPPERPEAAMVFQKSLLFPHMSVSSNVGFGLRMRGVPRDEAERRVGEALGRVRMEGFAERRPGELSGGQQQRVALARALVTEPRLLLLDEPLSALGANLREEMRELIKDLQREGGYTTVFVTHDQEEAVVLADRIALLVDGRLQMYDEP